MKNNLFYSLVFLASTWAIVPSAAQNVGNYLDEARFSAETKQITQFVRRFNNEESTDGKRYEPTDRKYHSTQGRSEYIRSLFDGQHTGITASAKEEFAQEMVKSGFFIDTHKGNWMAEVETRFEYKGSEMPLTIFLELKASGAGYKWVISDVFFQPYNALFHTDTVGRGNTFLHPMSHEIGFMNIKQAMENKPLADFYTDDAFEPDYLTMLIYDVKNGVQKFKTITRVKFHFFQVPGWYFELSYFNRTGNNTGWLISGITKASDKDKADILRFVTKGY